MRIAACLIAACALLLPASAAHALPGDPRYEMTFHISNDRKRTVFLADEAAAIAGQLPLLRICYESGASHPRPDFLSVHLGARHQLLGPGECGFFAGEHIETAVWRGSGSLRVTAALLR